MPRFTKIAALVAATITLGGVAPAHAATPTPHGPGAAAVEQCHGYLLDAGPRLKKVAGFRTEFIGTIRNGGQCGICPDYGLQGPDGRWTSGSYSWIKDREVRERVAWLANAYWADAAKSDRQAAALKVAINRLLSPDFRADWPGYAKQLRAKDAGVAPRADEMLTASKAVGTVKMTAVVTSKPKPGGVGVVEVKATGNGRPLAGQPVRWTVANARTVSSSTTTRADGTATLKVAWDGATALQVSAEVTSPEWRKAVYSTPSSGRRQHLLRGSYAVKSAARVRYDAALGVTVTQDCSGTCDGKPPVTFEAEAGATATTWQALVGGKVVKTLAVPAGKKASATFTGADGDVVTLRYRTGKGAWRTAKTFTVVCPPWPDFKVACACDGTFAVVFDQPSAKHYYTATVGSSTVSLPSKAPVTTPLKTGAAAAITVTAYSDAAHKHPIGKHTYGTWQQG